MRLLGGRGHDRGNEKHGSDPTMNCCGRVTLRCLLCHKPTLLLNPSKPKVCSKVEEIRLTALGTWVAYSRRGLGPLRGFILRLVDGGLCRAQVVLDGYPRAAE